MDLMISIVISMIVGALLIEGYAWLPRLSKWMIERAVRRLRIEDQARCREEWAAGMNDFPNTIVCLVQAMSLFNSAAEINEEAFRTRFDDLDDLLGKVRCQRDSIAERMQTATNDLQSTTATFHKTADEFLFELGSIKEPITDLPSGEQALGEMASIESSTLTLVKAVDKSQELLDISLRIARSRLERIRESVESITAERHKASKQWSGGKIGVTDLDNKMNVLASRLSALEDEFKDGNWGDDTSMSQYKLLMATIREVVGRMSSPAATNSKLEGLKKA